MDEMKINLSSPFLKTIISKIFKKMIAKQLDVHPDIYINEVSVRYVDDKIQMHISVDGSLPSEELSKALNRAGLL